MTHPNERSEAVRKISQNVITAANNNNFPLTIENYTLWYSHFEGTMPELSKTINDIIKKKNVITQPINSFLFRKFIGTSHPQDIIENVQTETQDVLREIIENILTGTDASSSYEKRLIKHTKELGTQKSNEQIQKIVLALIKDTKTMADANQKLQHEFSEAKAQTEKLTKKLELIQAEAVTDALTGINNRRAFDKAINHLIESFSSSGTHFSVIVFDVDHFKKFNDTYGHQTGDAVLKTVGEILIKSLKGQETPYRYGGEEFVILLPNTQIDHALIIAEQIRIRIAVTKIEDPQTKTDVDRVTISNGIARIRKNDTALSIIERADKALYLAKTSGRNTTKTEKDI